MKKIFLSCSLLTLAAVTNAQISFGPEVGLNLSSYYGKTNGTKQPGISPLPGGRFGAVADLGMGKHLLLQPGVFYTMNGYKAVATDYINNNTITYKFRVNTLEVPVNLMYNIHSRNGNYAFFGVGPYLGVNLGGKATTDVPPYSGKTDVVIGSGDTDNIKRIDAGVGISAGYQTAFGFFFLVHYQTSLINLQPMGNSDNSMKNANYGLSVGYLFTAGHTKKKMHNVSKK